MTEKIKYINHINQCIDFGTKNIFVNENELHDFSWSVISKNDRISSFKKGIVTKTIPIIIKCDYEEEGIKVRNELFEVMEKDILAVKHGKLVIGNYYLKCYVVESKKKEYSISNGYMKLTLKITSDYPSWIRETSTSFNYGSAEKIGTNLDYNRDFPSDYTSNLLGKQLSNPDFVSSNFKINIYGPCISPEITINGHVYSVDVPVESNEYLTIDSIDKTILLTKSDGSKHNCFNKRNKDSYIFQKIPDGLSNVAANGDFKFDIVLLEERGEPKWI